MPLVHRSRIDRWLLALVSAAVAVSLAASVQLALNDVAGKWPLIAVSLGLGVGLPVWVFASTAYVIDAGVLSIRSGPCRWRVPIADITSITPTRNPFSSPALSLDRLEIVYGPGRIVRISPRDPEAFLADLGWSDRTGFSRSTVHE